MEQQTMKEAYWSQKIAENRGSRLASDIGEAAFTHILIDPESRKETRTIYACAFGKGVYKSVDGGKTWTLKNKGISGTGPLTWQIVQTKRTGTLFLIVCRRSDDGSIGDENDGAIYRSDDGAESWVKLMLPQGTNAPVSLVIDKQDNNRVLLSAWGRLSKGQFSPDTGGGIFLSTDNCKTWKQVLGKDQHIHDITYDPRNNTYYACGFNSSAYRSEDRGETLDTHQGL